MQLQTEVKIEQAKNLLNYKDEIMLIGSCFVENIGSKLERLGFNTCINPSGIVYNPISLATTLDALIESKIYTEKDLNYQEGLWFSFDHHGSFSSKEMAICLENINKQRITASEHLKNAKLLIITFGTSWIYKHIVNNKIISNCHKIPNKEFIRYRLDISEIVDKYTYILEKLWHINPQLNVLFTVSPIRHWKDGAHGNQLSKSILLLAIDRLNQHFNKTAYFPSYEIVMDELRDYRFYTEDMLHISQQGINYIWEKFSMSHFTAETITIIQKAEKLLRLIEHRSLTEDNEQLKAQQQQALKEFQELRK